MIPSWIANIPFSLLLDLSHVSLLIYLVNLLIWLIGEILGNKEVKIVSYADDAIMMSEDEDNLQRLPHRFESTMEKYNASISVQKIQSLVIARKPRRCKLSVHKEKCWPGHDFQVSRS